MDTELLTTFIVASTLLSLAPGPDNIFVLLQSALHGPKAGLLITLGLCTGLLVHTTLVALGVAALVLVSPTAFLMLKLLGAAWLVWLAAGALRAADAAVDSGQPPALSPLQLYRRGILMNLTNPKVAIFFLAFLPQFANPETGSVTAQLLVLGGVFIVVALVVFGLVALLSGHLAQVLLRSARARLVLNRLAAVVFLGLATRLVLSPD